MQYPAAAKNTLEFSTYEAESASIWISFKKLYKHSFAHAHD